jgi:hypothetical protein
MLVCVNGTDPSISEDRVDFPDEWRERTLDRRGRGTPREVTVDPDAPQQLKALFAKHAEAMEEVAARPEVAGYAAAIRAGMAGEADPQGAALALLFLAQIAPGVRRTTEELGRDAWIGMHGLAFACQAMTELIGYDVHYPRARHYQIRARIMEPDVERVALILDHVDRISTLRSLLAGLPDDEYEAVRDAVAARRTSEAKRFGAALLMPEQADWAEEALKLHYGSRNGAWGYGLIWAIASDREQAELAGARVLGVYGKVAERAALLVDALGADSLPVLVNTLEGENRPDAEVRELLFDTIGRLPSEAAAAYLLGHLTNPLAAAAAVHGARRFPVRYLRAIASLAPNAHAATRVRLAGFARGNGLLDRADALSKAERELVTALVERRHPDAATLPAHFATPPWAPYAKPASKRAALDLTPPAIDELRWAADEQQSWLEANEHAGYWRDSKVWSRYRHGELDDPKHYYYNQLVAYGPEARSRTAFEKWDGNSEFLSAQTFQAIIARYGDEAKARSTALLKRKSSLRDALAPFVNLDIARLCAGWLSRSRNERTAAKAWLDRHAEAAAALLVPDAVGKDPKFRKTATDALRYLERSVVEAQAAVYGDEASAAVTALLDADPFDPQLPRIPKPGAWADPNLLPQVLLADRSAALPDAAVRTLMTALVMDTPERPYPGVDALAAECDPASLAAFSWGLFELWLSVGSPSKDAWAMDQLRRFADDYAVRSLADLIREWPGQSQNRKAVRGVEVLGGVGSESALRAVHAIAQKAKFKALKKTAGEQIEVIAERLELTLEQLGDRLVPDFGLAEESLVLDYGPRSFTIKFDEALKPYVIDDKGKRRASAPKPNAKDDLEIAQPAYERFAALRKDLKATAAEQVKRLEAAMAAGRTWSRAEFQEFLVDHPLMRQLSSRLVWQAGDASFRLAEDWTLADAEDEPFELPEDAAVRLAHPLTLGDEVAAWAEVFADYEILQPFDQLARPVFELSEEDGKTGRLSRFEGATTGGGPLLGLLNRGWKFGGPPGRGGYGLYRELPGGGWVYLDSNPGVHPGYGYDNGDQTLDRVELSLPEGGIDPVVASEVMLVIARLSRSAQ